MLVWGGVLAGGGKSTWWLFLEAMFPLANATVLTTLVRGFELSVVVVAAVTYSAAVATVLLSGFCLCMPTPDTALFFLSKTLEAGHGGGRLSGLISRDGSLMPYPPSQPVRSPTATRVGDGVVEEVGTGLVVSHCRVVLCDQVCCARLWLWLYLSLKLVQCMPVLPMVLWSVLGVTHV